MDYEEKANDILNTYAVKKFTWKNPDLAYMIESALKAAYAEGFMDCLNKSLELLSKEKENVN